MLKLYYAKGTAALAPHILLHEAGLPHEVHLLDFASKQHQAPDYAAVNPKQRVPALVTDQGVLTETPALLLYIAQLAPQAGLAPLETPFALAVAQEFNAYLCATVHVNHAHKMRGARWSDDPESYDSMRAKVPQNMAESGALIEQKYLKGPWVLGETYSLCDPYLYTVTRWMEADGVDMGTLPALTAHRAAIEARPATQAVLQFHS